MEIHCLFEKISRSNKNNNETVAITELRRKGEGWDGTEKHF